MKTDQPATRKGLSNAGSTAASLHRRPARAERLSRSRPRGRAAILALALLVMGIVTGVAGAAMAAGVMALVAALARRRAWCGLTALAGGILLFVCATGMGLLTLGYVLPGQMTQLSAWGVIAMPFALAAGIRFLLPLCESKDADRAGSGPAARETAFLMPVLVTIMGVALTAGAVDATVDGFAAAWAMSGDARNHVFVLRGVIDAGGITVDSLRAYPLLFNGFVAAHAAAEGRPLGQPGELLQEDVDSLAALYVLIVALLAGVVASAAAQVVSLCRTSFEASGLGAYLLAGGAGLLVMSPIVLGTALKDGFFTGLAGLLIFVCAIMTTVRSQTVPSAETALVTGAAGLLLLMVWPLLALICAPLAALAALALFRRTGKAALLAAGCTAVLALIPPLVFYATRAQVVPVLLLPGAITRPSTWYLVVLVASITLGYFLLRGSPMSALHVPAVTAFAGVVLIVFLAALGEQPAFWGYYSAKTLWLLESSLAYLTLVPAAYISLQRPAEGAGVAERLARHGATASLVLVALGVIAMGSPLGPPLERARTGWMQPSTGIANDVMANGNEAGPYVFWNWSVPQVYNGDDRLANFWAMAVWAVRPDGTYTSGNTVAGGPVAWAYRAGGDTSELCELAAGVPGLRIHTRDGTLQAKLSEACPAAQVSVRLEPS